MNNTQAKVGGVGIGIRRWWRSGLRTGLALIFLLLGACTESAEQARTPLLVFAASSLTDGFGQLEKAYEQAHPDVDVKVTYAGSQVLRLQIEQGAAADVYASANARHMQALQRAKLVDDSHIFAHNQPVVIVPTSNPAGLVSFRDLPKAQRVVIGTENVPIGTYTRRILAQVGSEFDAAVRTKVVSQENNVRLLRAKVELEEADAAIVFRTDAQSSKRVTAIEIPTEWNVRADYMLGKVRGAPHGQAAAAFVAFVATEPAQAILRQHGFLSP